MTAHLHAVGADEGRASGPASSVPARIEDRDITSGEAANRLEIAALDEIASVQDPDIAIRLLENARVVERVVRVKKLGEDRVRRWSAVVLRAERRYGELLGPAQPGGDGSNQHKKSNPSREGVASKIEENARRQARKVATVPEEQFEDYVSTNTSPSRAGLLRGQQPKRNHPRQVEPKFSREEADRKFWPLFDKGQNPDTVAETYGQGERIARDAYQRWLGARSVSATARPATPAKPGSISGKSAAKRLREISQERKKSGAQAFLDVRNFMYRLNKVTQVLASWQPGDLGLATDDEYGDVTLDRALMLSSDLLDLDQWLGRVTASVDRYLTQYDRVEQIRKIDALIANPATSPEEAVNYRRIRDRKQRNLDAEIMSAAAGGGESNEQDH